MERERTQSTDRERIERAKAERRERYEYVKRFVEAQQPPQTTRPAEEVAPERSSEAIAQPTNQQPPLQQAGDEHPHVVGDRLVRIRRRPHQRSSR